MKLRFHLIPKRAIKVPVPDTTQVQGYSCGASALQAVCKYYGVGREDEWDFVDDLHMNKKEGSHPFQITRAARKYGLAVIEKVGMSIPELKYWLRRKRPVLLMIQAWRDTRRSYKDDWEDGHWVVAIGYDRKGIFFEDPSLQAVRGYLTNSDLRERWHDVGPEGAQVEHYGMVLWRRGSNKSAYTTRAEFIG